MNRPTFPVAVIAATVLFGGAFGGRVLALFTDSASVGVPVTVTAPVVPRPSSMSCFTDAGNALAAPAGHVSWTHPTGGVLPTQYRIRAQGGLQIAQVDYPATTFVFNTGLLGGLLGTIRSLLAANPNLPITVNAVYGGAQAYESPSDFSRMFIFETTGGTLGLLRGIGCSLSGAPLMALDLAIATTTSSTTTSTTTSTIPKPAPTTTTLLPASTSTIPPTSPATSPLPSTTGPATSVTEPPATTTAPPTASTVPATTSTTTTTTTTTQPPP